MLDQGKNDEKIIAIPFHDPTYNSYKNIDDLPSHIFQEMMHFFSVYKSLESKKTKINELDGEKAAKKIIAKSKESYIKNYCL